MTASEKPDTGDLENLARKALQAASDRDGYVAVAESCTGGSVAGVLTGVKGLSHVFDRGFITYSDNAKSEMLDIDMDVIERAGAVSEEVGTLMAQRTLEKSRALASVAVTGFAGGAPPDEENGLIHIVAVSKSGTILHRECHFGDVSRDDGSCLATAVALELLGQAIEATD